MTADQLRQHRRRFRQTKAAMALLLGVPYKTYEKWESGERRMSAIVQEHLLRKIKALDMLEKKSLPPT